MHKKGKSMYKKYDEETFIIETENADIWVSKNASQKNVSYYYGGTRTVPFGSSDAEAWEKISYLKRYESGLKNILINDVIASGAFDSISSELPEGYLSSRVGGGRCVILPKNKTAEEILSDPTDSRYCETVIPMFRELGGFLNQEGMNIKLTPDFGSFSGLADLLHGFTENVLGIACEKSGCGGKSSYTSTGINQAAITLGAGKDSPITIIGCEGGCGKGCLDYFIENGYTDIAVCDLKLYADKQRCTELEAKGIKILAVEKGRFTDECLGRGGYIIAATTGGEFLSSNISIIKHDTYLLLAHNEAIPADENGISFAERVQDKQHCCIVPGQILTFGGAMTSRLEWFFRCSHKGEYFPKQLAHRLVAEAADIIVRKYFANPFDKCVYRELYSLV